MRSGEWSAIHAAIWQRTRAFASAGVCRVSGRLLISSCAAASFKVSPTGCGGDAQNTSTAWSIAITPDASHSRIGVSIVASGSYMITRLAAAEFV